MKTSARSGPTDFELAHGCSIPCSSAAALVSAFGDGPANMRSVSPFFHHEIGLSES